MPFLSIVNVSKRFGDIVALEDVTLDINEGEIIGLLGENGSGKSTLAKIIYGVYVPDKGHVTLYKDGIPQHVFFTSPRDAIKHGIVMISQRPQLVEEISAVDNITLFLGVSPHIARKIVESTLNRFNIELNLEKTVNTLSYTEKQFVELVKALSYKPKLLIVDEATTYLPKDVRVRFYEVLKMFTSLGGSVLFVTHKIPEALVVCDRIAVLRKGKLVGLFSKGEGVSIDVVRKAMFSEISRRVQPSKAVEGFYGKSSEILRFEDLVVLDDYGRKAVDGASLSVSKGLIVAVIGIAGNGQRELCEGLAGLRKAVGGKIILDNEDITFLGAAERISKGLHYIPEDPFRDGVVLDLTIAENLRLFHKGRISGEIIAKVLEDLKVYPLNPELKVYKLSGGNVQKISIARLRLSKPKCTVVYNPTRMLDETSSNLVKSMLRDLASNNVGVLLVSEDIDEVLDVADEIAVISRGKIVKSFIATEPSIREEIEKAMTLYA
ncbi:MAG: ATP-binding cassette domain-containing protein [Ignisphaera sp.]|uniref:ATP-binding cassette domain-containing protein n=1 Tax=Ignisphaera aggregans TaxID=334771 RepID=A0A7C4NLW4_9CREN